MPPDLTYDEVERAYRAATLDGKGQPTQVVCSGKTLIVVCNAAIVRGRLIDPYQSYLVTANSLELIRAE